MRTDITNIHKKLQIYTNIHKLFERYAEDTTKKISETDFCRHLLYSANISQKKKEKMIKIVAERFQGEKEGGMQVLKGHEGEGAKVSNRHFSLHWCLTPSKPGRKQDSNLRPTVAMPPLLAGVADVARLLLRRPPSQV